MYNVSTSWVRMKNVWLESLQKQYSRIRNQMTCMRWSLHLASSGTVNEAEYPSRHPDYAREKSQLPLNFIVNHTIPKSMTIWRKNCELNIDWLRTDLFWIALSWGTLWNLKDQIVVTSEKYGTQQWLTKSPRKMKTTSTKYIMRHGSILQV